MMPICTNRSKKLDLRLSAVDKTAPYAAAAAARRSVSEFVLESVLKRVEETLAGRHHFGLSADQWSGFMATLEAPPRQLPRLQRLLNEPSLFDESEAQ
jgi:uncharacterized protein (DUF1778 family)